MDDEAPRADAAYAGASWNAGTWNSRGSRTRTTRSPGAEPRGVVDDVDSSIRRVHPAIRSPGSSRPLRSKSKTMSYPTPSSSPAFLPARDTKMVVFAWIVPGWTVSDSGPSA